MPARRRMGRRPSARSRPCLVAHEQRADAGHHVFGRRQPQSSALGRKCSSLSRSCKCRHRPGFYTGTVRALCRRWGQTSISTVSKCRSRSKPVRVCSDSNPNSEWYSVDIVLIFACHGAPRSMKMGTIASRWRYEAIADYALQAINLRWLAIFRYASSAAVFPIS
jgi:hypothetical protein